VKKFQLVFKTSLLRGHSSDHVHLKGLILVQIWQNCALQFTLLLWIGLVIKIPILTKFLDNVYHCGLFKHSISETEVLSSDVYKQRFLPK
jgi:hypothetical protein